MMSLIEVCLERRVALDQRLQRDRREVVGADGLQRALHGASDGRAYGVDDHCLWHLSLSPWGWGRRDYRSSRDTPSSSKPTWCASSWRTVRTTWSRSSSGSWPKSRRRVSLKITMRSWVSSRRRLPALVEPVGAAPAAAVGDHDGDVRERVAQQVGEVVEGVAHELFEVLVVERVELEELAFRRGPPRALRARAARSAARARRTRPRTRGRASRRGARRRRPRSRAARPRRSPRSLDPRPRARRRRC